MKPKFTDTPLPVADGDVETVTKTDGKGVVEPLYDRVRWGAWEVQFWYPDDSKKRIVRLLYGQNVTMEGSGQIAFENAQDMARHFHKRDSVPKRGVGKCLADLSPGARAKSCAGYKPLGELWKGAGR